MKNIKRLLFTMLFLLSSQIFAQVNWDQLARKYAPHIFLHSGDQYRPSSVDWYLSRVHMRYNNKSGFFLWPAPDAQILNKGQVRDNNISTQRYKGANSSDDFNNFFLQIPNDDDEFETRKGDFSLAKVYVKAGYDRRGNNAFEYLQYWVFYPYNGPLTGALGTKGAHEGDWESVTVIIENTGTPSEQIKEIYLSQHSSGELINGNNIDLNGTHPIVYSAKDSHAFYSFSGRKDRPGFYSDYMDEGIPWDTSGDLVFLDYPGNKEKLHHWLDFGGRWGEIGIIFHGPSSPPLNGDWTKYSKSGEPGDVVGNDLLCYRSIREYSVRAFNIPYDNFTWEVTPAELFVRSEGVGNIASLRVRNYYASGEATIKFKYRKNSQDQVISETFWVGVPQMAQAGITGLDVVNPNQSLTYEVTPIGGVEHYQWSIPYSWNFSGNSQSSIIGVRTSDVGGRIISWGVNDCGTSFTQSIKDVTINSGEDGFPIHQPIAFPNPADSYLEVDISNLVEVDTSLEPRKAGSSSFFQSSAKQYQIKLYNQLLMLVHQEETDEDINIDTSALKEGTYFLVIDDGHEIIKRQILVRH